MATISTNQILAMLWLCGSVALYTIGAHSRQKLAQFAGSSRWLHPALLRAGEALFYLGLPYLALLRGDILLRVLGLSGLDWIQDVGLGITLGVGALAASVVALRYALRREEDHRAGTCEPAPVIAYAGAGRPSKIEVLWGAILLQVHWAFYRAALIQVIGDAYWGAFAGVLLIVLERALTPGIRSRLREPVAGPREIASLLMAALTAILYVYVRNLPLLIVFHWTFEVMLHSAIISWPTGMQPANQD